MLKAVAETFGDKRQVVVAREITKKFETLYRGSASDLSASFEGIAVKGEIVVMVAGADQKTEADPDAWRAALAELLKDMPLRGAVDQIAADFDLKRKQVYQAALEMRDG